MELPKKVKRRGKQYFLIKEYKNYGLYKEERTGIRTCFSKFDLGLIPETIKTSSNVNPERKYA